MFMYLFYIYNFGFTSLHRIGTILTICGMMQLVKPTKHLCILVKAPLRHQFSSVAKNMHFLGQIAVYFVQIIIIF